MTDQVTAPAPKLGFGIVIKGTFGVIKRNFVTFLTLIIGLNALPIVPMVIGAMELVAQRYVTGGSLLAIGGIGLAVASCVLQAGLIHATVADLNGRQASAGDCIRTGLRNFLPLIGIITLMILGAFGAVFLVFIPFGLLAGQGGPGPLLLLLLVPLIIALYVVLIMVAVAWCVIFPAQVVERAGVLGSFTRSGQLTKNNRWRIFGLFVLWGIVSSVVQGVLTNLVGAGSASSLAAAQATSPAAALAAFGPAYWVIVAVMGVVGAMVGSAGVAVVYYELRRIKEGIGPEALASVFD